MEIDKSNTVLWDIDVVDYPLYEIAFMLNIKKISEINNKLHKEGKDIRASYSRLSDFIHTLNIHPELFKKELKKANVMLRKYKIQKIINNG
jgi:hypothetical protein